MRMFIFLLGLAYASESLLDTSSEECDSAAVQVCEAMDLSGSVSSVIQYQLSITEDAFKDAVKKKLFKSECDSEKINTEDYSFEKMDCEWDCKAVCDNLVKASERILRVKVPRSPHIACLDAQCTQTMDVTDESFTAEARESQHIAESAVIQETDETVVRGRNMFTQTRITETHVVGGEKLTILHRSHDDYQIEAHDDDHSVRRLPSFADTTARVALTLFFSIYPTSEAFDEIDFDEDTAALDPTFGPAFMSDMGNHKKRTIQAVADAIGWTAKALRLMSSESSERLRKQWFGVSWNNEREIRRILNGVLVVLDRVVIRAGALHGKKGQRPDKRGNMTGSDGDCPVDYDADGQKTGTLAYVYENHKEGGRYVIFLCEFMMDFDYADWVSTLIHEGTHHFGTNDWIYGRAQAEKMAQDPVSSNRDVRGRFTPRMTGDQRALSNAANVQYFVTDLVADVTPQRPAPTKAKPLYPIGSRVYLMDYRFTAKVINVHYSYNDGRVKSYDCEADNYEVYNDVDWSRVGSVPESERDTPLYPIGSRVHCIMFPGSPVAEVYNIRYANDGRVARYDCRDDDHDYNMQYERELKPTEGSNSKAKPRYPIGSVVYIRKWAVNAKVIDVIYDRHGRIQSYACKDDQYNYDDVKESDMEDELVVKVDGCIDDNTSVDRFVSTYSCSRLASIGWCEEEEYAQRTQERCPAACNNCETESGNEPYDRDRTTPKDWYPLPRYPIGSFVHLLKFGMDAKVTSVNYDRQDGSVVSYTCQNEKYDYNGVYEEDIELQQAPRADPKFPINSHVYLTDYAGRRGAPYVIARVNDIHYYQDDGSIESYDCIADVSGKEGRQYSRIRESAMDHVPPTPAYFHEQFDDTSHSYNPPPAKKKPVRYTRGDKLMYNYEGNKWQYVTITAFHRDRDGSYSYDATARQGKAAVYSRAPRGTKYVNINPEYLGTATEDEVASRAQRAAVAAIPATEDEVAYRAQRAAVAAIRAQRALLEEDEVNEEFKKDAPIQVEKESQPTSQLVRTSQQIE